MRPLILPLAFLCFTVSVHAQQEASTDLQRRASLVWEDYREALLAHPDAMELPLEHLDAGHTVVVQRGKQLLGFSVVLPRADGDADLDGLFVEPVFLETRHGQTPRARS